MNLSHDALRDLTALAELKSEGGIRKRHFLELTSRVINDNGRVGDSSLERLGMALRVGAFSEAHASEAHSEARAVGADNKITKILDNRDGVEFVGGSATPSAPPIWPAGSSERKRAAAKSGSAAGRTPVNRGAGERKRAATQSWNVIQVSLTMRKTRRLCRTTNTTRHRRMRRS